METQGHHLRTFLDSVQEDFRKIEHQKHHPTARSNLSKGEKLALRSLNNDKNLVIHAADKGRGVVLLDLEDYQKEADNILSYKTYYELILDNPFPNSELEFSRFIKKTLEENTITKEEAKFLLIDHPNRPHFYYLPKIHKHLENLPGRPTIAGVNSLTSNLSHYIDIYLQDYVKNLQSYQRDSDDLKTLLHLPWT